MLLWSHRLWELAINKLANKHFRNTHWLTKYWLSRLEFDLRLWQPFCTLITTLKNYHQLLMTSANGRAYLSLKSILSRVLNRTTRLRRFLPHYRGQRSKIVPAEEYEWTLLGTVKEVQWKAFRKEKKFLCWCFRYHSEWCHSAVVSKLVVKSAELYLQRMWRQNFILV